MAYNPTRIEIVSNFDTLYLESHLFDTSCSLINDVARSKGLYIREVLDRILSDYPINGTVEEKRDWYFKRYDIIGSFQSGILVGKKYVDPETQLEKDLLSELHMDHKVNMNNFSILEDIASTNSLDVNKFVGYAEEGSPGSNSPYLWDITKTYPYPIYVSISSAPQAYSGSITDAYNNGVYFAYADSRASHADVCIIPQNTNVIFQYNNSSTYPDVFGNPVEGSWGIIKEFAVYYNSEGGIYHGKWYATSVLYPGSGVYSSSSVMYAGAIVRYTSGNWIITGAIMPKVTNTQYRANETE